MITLTIEIESEGLPYAWEIPVNFASREAAEEAAKVIELETEEAALKGEDLIWIGHQIVDTPVPFWTARTEELPS